MLIVGIVALLLVRTLLGAANSSAVANGLGNVDNQTQGTVDEAVGSSCFGAGAIDGRVWAALRLGRACASQPFGPVGAAGGAVFADVCMASKVGCESMIAAAGLCGGCAPVAPRARGLSTCQCDRPM